MKRQPSLGINARLLLMTLLPTALMALVIGGYFSSNCAVPNSNCCNAD